MKICIVSHEYEPFPGGGIATYHTAAAKVLAAAGHEVHFVTNAATYGSKQRHHAQRVRRSGNLTIHRLRNFDENRKVPPESDMFGAQPAALGDIGSHWARDASNIAALHAAAYIRELHAKVGLDVIESPEFFAEAYYMVRARHAGRTSDFPPICIHGHVSSRIAFRTNRHFWDLGYHPHRQMMAREEYCVRFADALLTPSRSLMTRYEEEYGEMLPRLRATMPYFLELPESGTDRLPAAIDDGKPFLLCVGRLEPRKGTDLAMQAFAELGRQYPDLRLVFLGREMWHQGETIDELLRTHVPAELIPRVLRPGTVPREQVLAAIAKAAAFLHPAPWDNYPCATLEAMAVGGLCVVSDQGGQAEMVEDGVSGLVHRSGDLEQLIELVRRALDDGTASQHMRAAAAERARALTDPVRLVGERIRFFEAICDTAARRGAAAARLPTLPGTGTIVIDAGDSSPKQFLATRDALIAELPDDGRWKVAVLAAAASPPDTPAGWNVFTTLQPPVWQVMAPTEFVVWMMSGVALEPGKLTECVTLVAASPDPCGSFPWLQSESNDAFPYSPDLGSRDLLVEGHVLPPAFVVSAGALHGIRSLSGMPHASQRLAALLTAIAARPGMWFRHTPDVVGRFAGPLPTLTLDLQRRSLGHLDVLGELEPAATLFGGAPHRAPEQVAAATSMPAIPGWVPSRTVADQLEARSAEHHDLVVDNCEQLGAAFAVTGASILWRVDANNWFELIEVATRCTAAGCSLQFDVATTDASLARVPVVDLVAVYQCVRDWWTCLAGPERPAGLHAEAHNRLVECLRDMLRWRAERVREGEPDGDLRLQLPHLEHAVVASDVGALRLWRSFLAGRGSETFEGYLAALAGHVDLPELVASRAWVRVLVQHRLWTAWDATAHHALYEVYSNARKRRRMIERELEACSEARGLDWWVHSVHRQLGIDRTWGRRKPFRAPPRSRSALRPENPPIVTVLIPSYRHETYIAETVHSALNQSLRELRVLVVDDGSPDDTVAAARSLSDPRLEVRENRTNLGLGESVLKALDSVDTPFVALLNSDDIFHPERLKLSIKELIDDASVDLVCTGLALVDRDGKSIGRDSVGAWYDGRNVHDWVHWYEGILPRAGARLDLFRELLQRNFLVTSSNIVCRTDWLRAQSETLTGLKYCLDWQLFLTAALHGRLRYLPKPLVAYRLHPSNTVWFDRSTRWAYTLEVNRVAATAVRQHLELRPDDDEQAVAEALRDVAEALRKNTEIDWLGMFVNNLVGGARLDTHAHSSGAGSELLQLLPGIAAEPAREAGRVGVQLRMREAETRLLTDELHSLRSKFDWHVGRAAELRDALQDLRDAARRLEKELQQRAHEQQTLASTLKLRDAALASTKQALEDRSQELQRQIDDLVGKHDQLAGDLATRTTGLAQSESHVAQLDEELAIARHDIDALRTDLLQERTSAANLRGRLEQTRTEAHGLTERLERELSTIAELRRSVEEMRTANADVHRQLESARHALDAVRRRHCVARDSGKASRESMARELAATRLSLHRAEAESRSTRSGSTTREARRRLRKLGRKLRGLATAIDHKVRSSAPTAPVLLLTETRQSPETLTEDALFEGIALRRVELVDSNHENADVPAGVERVFFFPERGPRLLRTLAANLGADAAAWRAETSEAAAVAAMAPTTLLGEATQLGQQLAATRASMLVTNGGLTWNARISLGALFANRPWIAIVDMAPPQVSAASTWPLSRLQAADLVIARSRAIADLLVNSGVDVDRVLVDYPSPLDGVLAGARAFDTVLAFGRFESAGLWDDCITGFVAATDHDCGPALRIVATVRPNDTASLAAEMAARDLASQWPKRVTVESVHAERPDWPAVLAGPAPAGLLWVGRKGGTVVAPHPVVLSAIAAGLPVAAWVSPESEDLFGSLGAVPRIDIEDETSFAAVLRDMVNANAAPYRAAIVRARFREVSAGDLGREAIRARILDLLELR